MHSRFAARASYLLVILAGLLASAHRADAQQAAPPRFVVDDGATTASDSSAQPQQHAIEHTDAYYTRLTIHRIGSYAILPLFGAEYYLGNKLIKGGYGSGVQSAHKLVAAGIEGLFAVNTFTGVWNLVEARNDPNKLRRYLHSALMLGSDAGFVYTGLISAHDAKYNLGAPRTRHRNAAIISMSAATAGTALMWLWKN